MKKLLSEFKSFIMRGNVLDLAVAVIIGGAFQAIIGSAVNDIISPFIGVFAKTDFSSFVFNLNGVEIKYGAFLTAVINFLIMALVIFLLVKVINKLASVGKKPKDQQEVTEKACPYCCTDISIKAVKCPNCTSDLNEGKAL